MKQFNEVKLWKKQLDEESRQTTLDMLIVAQIQGLEKLMENNGGYVQSALAYNRCVGLIDQLKYYAYAAFRPAENTLDQEISSYDHKLMEPKYK